MTAPTRPDVPPLDATLAEIAREPGRTWGVRDAMLGVLAVPASLLLVVSLLAIGPTVPGALATALATAVLAALTLVVSRRPARQSGGARRALGFDLPRGADTGRIIGWAALLLVAQVAALSALTALVPGLRDVPVDNVGFLREERLATVLVVGVAAVIVAPVLEELLFRGLVLRGLMLKIGFWPAAVVSSAFFGVFHAQGTGLEAVPIVVATGVFGLGLCVLVRRTGRLGPAIGVHALRNAIAVGAVLLA